MKFGFVVATACVPLYNILLLCFAALTDMNAALTIAICFAGSVIIGLVIFNIVIKPYVSMMADMETALEAARTADNARNEFVYSIAEAFYEPVENMRMCVRDIADLGPERIASSKPVEEEDDDMDEIDRMIAERKKEEGRDKSVSVSREVYAAEVVERRIKELKHEMDCLQELTEDVHTLAQLENKKRVAQSGSVNVNAAIEDVIKGLESKLDEKKLDLITDLEDGIVLEGVPERFKMMMHELLDNAVRYSSKGGTIWITSAVIEGFVIVSVKDNGIGINESDQKRIFERFYRAPMLTDPNPTGSGLGLAIVQRVAELSDAEVKVNSVYGEGSTFSILFKRGL